MNDKDSKIRGFTRLVVLQPQVKEITNRKGETLPSLALNRQDSTMGGSESKAEKESTLTTRCETASPANATARHESASTRHNTINSSSIPAYVFSDIASAASATSRRESASRISSTTSRQYAAGSAVPAASTAASTTVKPADDPKTAFNSVYRRNPAEELNSSGNRVLADSAASHTAPYAAAPRSNAVTAEKATNTVKKPSANAPCSAAAAQAATANRSANWDPNRSTNSSFKTETSTSTASSLRASVQSTSAGKASNEVGVQVSKTSGLEKPYKQTSSASMEPQKAANVASPIRSTASSIQGQGLTAEKAFSHNKSYVATHVSDGKVPPMGKPTPAANPSNSRSVVATSSEKATKTVSSTDSISATADKASNEHKYAAAKTASDGKVTATARTAPIASISRSDVATSSEKATKTVSSKDSISAPADRAINEQKYTGAQIESDVVTITAVLVPKVSIIRSVVANSPEKATKTVSSTDSRRSEKTIVGTGFSGNGNSPALGKPVTIKAVNATNTIKTVSSSVKPVPVTAAKSTADIEKVTIKAANATNTVKTISSSVTPVTVTAASRTARIENVGTKTAENVSCTASSHGKFPEKTKVRSDPMNPSEQGNDLNKNNGKASMGSHETESSTNYPEEKKKRLQEIENMIEAARRNKMAMSSSNSDFPAVALVPAFQKVAAEERPEVKAEIKEAVQKSGNAEEEHICKVEKSEENDKSEIERPKTKPKKRAKKKKSAPKDPSEKEDTAQDVDCDNGGDRNDENASVDGGSDDDSTQGTSNDSETNTRDETKNPVPDKSTRGRGNYRGRNYHTTNRWEPQTDPYHYYNPNIPPPMKHPNRTWHKNPGNPQNAYQRNYPGNNYNQWQDYSEESSWGPWQQNNTEHQQTMARWNSPGSGGLFPTPTMPMHHYQMHLANQNSSRQNYCPQEPPMSARRSRSPHPREENEERPRSKSLHRPTTREVRFASPSSEMGDRRAKPRLDLEYEPTRFPAASQRGASKKKQYQREPTSSMQEDYTGGQDEARYVSSPEEASQNYQDLDYEQNQGRTNYRGKAYKGNYQTNKQRSCEYYDNCNQTLSPDGMDHAEPDGRSANYRGRRPYQSNRGPSRALSPHGMEYGEQGERPVNYRGRRPYQSNRGPRRGWKQGPAADRYSSPEEPYQEDSRRRPGNYRSPTQDGELSPPPYEQRRGARPGPGSRSHPPKDFNEVCPICSDPIGEEHFVTLDCDHRLHNKCAFKMAQKVKDPFCPLCCKSLNIEDEDEDKF